MARWVFPTPGYSMGGYRFGDFARLGAPITLSSTAVALLVIPQVWPLR